MKRAPCGIVVYFCCGVFGVLQKSINNHLLFFSFQNVVGMYGGMVLQEKGAWFSVEMSHFFFGLDCHLH